MRKISFIIAGMMLGIGSYAWAAGIGVYGTGGYESGPWTGKSATTTGTVSWSNDGKNAFGGGGLIIDSAAAKDMLFNYRFKLGYESASLELDGLASTLKPMNRFGMTHTFGFGVVRNKMLRFWLGPRIGVQYFQITEVVNRIKASPLQFIITSNMSPSLFQMMIPLYLREEEFKYDFISGSLMLACGVNFNIGEYTTLFIDLGVGYKSSIALTSSIMAHNVAIDGSAGVMFRINDTFQGSEGVK